MAGPEVQVLDFSQLRVTALADTLRDLVEQIKLTNSHVERLTRDVGHLKADMNQLRAEVTGLRGDSNERFGRVDRDLVDLRGDVILQPNQIFSAQQSSRQALAGMQDLLERTPPDEAP